VVRYLLRRVIQFFGVLLIISFVSFLIMRLLPGDPVVKHLGTSYTTENARLFEHQVGLDQGFFAQYFTWLGHIVTFNWGTSWTVSPGKANSTILAESLPPTLLILTMSQILGLVIAIPTAVAVVRRPNGRLDRSANAIMLGAYSIPTIVALPILTYVLTVKYNLLPGPSAWNSSVSVFAPQNLKVAVLPAIAIAISSLAGHFRFLRNDMIINLQEDFVVMARSKGLRDGRILWRHVLRPSSVTLLTSLGLTISGLIVGSFVVETFLSIPGFASWLLPAVDTSDFGLLQMLVMTVAFLVIGIQMLINSLLPLIDPRIARD